MIIGYSSEESPISYDNLELAVKEFITKFNFKPAFFIIGVSLHDIVKAVRIGEVINSSNLINMCFVHDRALDDEKWYILSLNNNEAYQLVFNCKRGNFKGLGEWGAK